MTIPESYELPHSRLAFFGRLSPGERPELTCQTFEELVNLPFEGSSRIRPYVQRYRPSVSVEVSCPMLIDGSVETKKITVTQHYGGALQDPNAHVENEFEELVLSFSAPAIVLSTVAGGPERQEKDTPDYPLLGLALGMQAIGDIMNSNWAPADGLDLERTEDRMQIRDTLVSGTDVDVPPTELVLAPDSAAVPFNPGLVDGAVTSLEEAAVAEMYRDVKLALLDAAPPDDNGSGYTAFLGDLRLKFRDALTTAISTICEADEKLARTWYCLGLLHSANPNPEPVRVADVAGDWLIPADGKLSPIVGPVKPENSSAQKEVFRSTVVPRDGYDQSKAALRVIVGDPIEDVRTLKSIGAWAEEEKVIVYVNVAARSLEELAATANQMQQGTPEDWGKHVVVVGDEFPVCRGEGRSTLSIPANVALVALQTRLDLRRPPAKGDAVSGIALSPTIQNKLIEFDGDARAIEKYLPRSRQRTIEALATRVTVRLVTKVWLNVPVPRHGGHGYATIGVTPLFRSSKRDSPERIFEHIAPVQVRNWIVGTIAYYLRSCYARKSIDEETLKQLRGELADWIKSLDDRKGRRFINAEKSEISVMVLDGDRLHVVAKLVYPPIIADISVSDCASLDAFESTDELTFERDEDGVWVSTPA